jgi:hypothetical protein
VSFKEDALVRYTGGSRDTVLVNGSVWTVISEGEPDCAPNRTLVAQQGNSDQKRCVPTEFLIEVQDPRAKVPYVESCPSAIEADMLDTFVGTINSSHSDLSTKVKELVRNAEDTPRGSVLTEARELINGDRNNSYGPPTQDFTRTAGILNALGYSGPDGRELQGHDIAIIIASVKMSRLMWTPGKRDNWVDLAGYAGCGYECAVEEGHSGQSALPDVSSNKKSDRVSA